jgi:hypothetical protein
MLLLANGDTAVAVSRFGVGCFKLSSVAVFEDIFCCTKYLLHKRCRTLVCDPSQRLLLVLLLLLLVPVSTSSVWGNTLSQSIWLLRLVLLLYSLEEEEEDEIILVILSLLILDC